MATVTYENVSKNFDGTVAVSELSLEVGDGEFIVLVGPSGCGKSTALRMLAGLERISEGRILIDDRVVNNVRPSARDVAMVFQSYALYPHMTVYDNLAFALRNRVSRSARSTSACGAPARSSSSPSCSSGSRSSSRADSGSGWRWGGRSCASPSSS